MTRAVICRPDGTLDEIDLDQAEPNEQALAITNHRELDLVRVLIRAFTPKDPS